MDKITFKEFYKKNALKPTLFIIGFMALIPFTYWFNGYDLDNVSYFAEGFALSVLIILYIGTRVSYKNYLRK